MRALGFVLAAAISTAALAQAPDQLVFQGRLVRTDGQPETATQTLTFTLYAAPSGGTALWSETHQDVVLNNGYYVVRLGSATPLPAVFDGTVRFLSVSLPGQSEMLPRMALASVPYALKAETAVSANTANSAQTAQAAQTAVSAQSADTAQYAADSALLGGQAPSSFLPASHASDLATPSSSGHMSAADKDKLDQVPTVWGNGINSTQSGGQYRVDVVYGGSGSSTSVARSDHSHALPKLSCSKVTATGTASLGVTATCATGELLTGGGCEDMPADNGITTHAAPNSSNGFFCQATGGFPPPSMTITAHGVCCKLVP